MQEQAWAAYRVQAKRVRGRRRPSAAVRGSLGDDAPDRMRSLGTAGAISKSRWEGGGWVGWESTALAELRVKRAKKLAFGARF
jgi:hypothetical protein